MTDEGEVRSIERWVSLAAGVVAPVTVLSALLFYFGYASTRATYEFFGVDVDTVGLGTRDYVMRSPQPLLVPMIALLLLGAVGVWLHLWVLATVRAGNQKGTRLVTRLAWGAVGGGALLLAAGAVLVVLFPAVRDWQPYDLVTPVCIGAGIALLAYGRHVLGLLGTPSGANTTTPQAGWLRGLSAVLVVAIVAGCVFWATATLAAWSGRGQAVAMAERFDELPAVILDTTERLYVRDPTIQEAALPVEEGQEFRYRYRNLRLLIHGEGRLFLVPEQWSRSGTTLVVPLDGSVRLQFQFENPG